MPRVFDGIHKLIVEEQRDFFVEPFQDLPLRVFDNISHLILTRITGIKTLALNSAKLSKLEVVHCHFEEIATWNDGNLLMSLVYLICFNSGNRPNPKIPSFAGIPQVTINDWSDITVQSFGNQSSFTCLSPYSKIPLEVLHQPFLLQKLISLTLDCIFPDEFHDFFFCRTCH
jgi:hypothetical protein